MQTGAEPRPNPTQNLDQDSQGRAKFFVSTLVWARPRLSKTWAEPGLVCVAWTRLKSAIKHIITGTQTHARTREHTRKYTQKHPQTWLYTIFQTCISMCKKETTIPIILQNMFRIDHPPAAANIDSTVGLHIIIRTVICKHIQ